jgi:aminoglycoside 6'-N-acetyltransferase I
LGTLRPAFQIRHVGPADAERWAALRAALWPDQPPAELADEAARFFSASGQGPGAMPEAVLLAVEPGPGGSLLGFAEVSRRAYAEGCNTSPIGFLEGWYVVPHRRREGIGRALVAAAEDWARSMGCTEFASDALADNAISAAAHQALGFEEVEVIRCFRKDLPPKTAS